MEDLSGIRLQKLLAHAGVASRRHAEEMILAGRVAVNGTQVDKLGIRVRSQDKVTVDGREISLQKSWHYYLINKPRGFITSVTDPQGRKTVLDLLKNLPARVYPVGRLDYDTSGLLLLTNDGELAYRLSHPSYGVEKTYRVWIKNNLSEQGFNTLRTGVVLEDGKTAPAKVKPVSSGNRQNILEITIHEGKNRQVRRMFAAVGSQVDKLERVRFGPLYLDDKLKPGLYRPLKDKEVDELYKAVGLSSKVH